MREGGRPYVLRITHHALRITGIPRLKRFAVIDIGTNSIRLAVVQPEGPGAYSVLSEQKEVVRLGEGEFTGNRLTTAAMDRALLVCAQFAEAARAQGAPDVTALA